MGIGQVRSDDWGIMGIPPFLTFACPSGRQMWERNVEEFASPPVANATGGYSPKALRALYHALSANFAYTTGVGERAQTIRLITIARTIKSFRSQYGRNCYEQLLKLLKFWLCLTNVDMKMQSHLLHGF